MVSSDHSDKTSFNYTETIELGIVFGVYSTEFQITGKPLLFYPSLSPNHPDELPEFLAFKVAFIFFTDSYVVSRKSLLKLMKTTNTWSTRAKELTIF